MILPIFFPFYTSISGCLADMFHVLGDGHHQVLHFPNALGNHLLVTFVIYVILKYLCSFMGLWLSFWHYPQLVRSLGQGQHIVLSCCSSRTILNHCPMCWDISPFLFLVMLRWTRSGIFHHLAQFLHDKNLELPLTHPLCNFPIFILKHVMYYFNIIILIKFV